MISPFTKCRYPLEGKVIDVGMSCDGPVVFCYDDVPVGGTDIGMTAILAERFNFTPNYILRYYRDHDNTSIPTIFSGVNYK